VGVIVESVTYTYGSTNITLAQNINLGNYTVDGSYGFTNLGGWNGPFLLKDYYHVANTDYNNILGCALDPSIVNDRFKFRVEGLTTVYS